MNNILTFNNPDFGEIRTVVIDDDVWFVGKDIAERLGYSNPQKAIRDRVDDEDKTVNVAFTVNGTQGLLINESGMYSLVLSSSLKSAKKFKKWVTSEVLPSIRKTGSYSVMPKTTAEKIKLLAESDMEIRKDVENIKGNMSDMKSEIDTLKDTMPLFPADADLISEAVKRKGVDVLGGKASEAYKDKGLKMSVFKDIYGQIHRNFGVKSYKSIRHKDCQNVLDVVSSYVLPLTLKERIHDANLQLTFV